MKLTQIENPITAGSMSGSGARNLLGAPPLDIPELLIRESAQNSWDARIHGQTPSFSVDLRKLDLAQTACLKEQYFYERRNLNPALLELLNSSGNPWVIEISDSGTRGLDGEWHPSRQTSTDDSNNFRNLIWTYGAPRDVENGGGTYGFGKASAWSASNSATVIYWTRCFFNGKYEYRLITSSINDAYTDNGKAYTGRQWWGTYSEQDGEMPLIGNAAQILGEALFNRRFDIGETGTSILILDPIMPENGETRLTHEQYGEALRDATIRNLWPKMTRDSQGRLPMKISVAFKGAPYDFGSQSKGLWKIWADSLNLARDVLNLPEKERVMFSAPPSILATEIGYLSPPDRKDILKHLGYCAGTREFYLGGNTAADNVFASLKNHFCLMRSVELVIKYDSIPAATDSIEYSACVFKVSSNREIDEIFAKTENPSHSDWVPSAKDTPYKNAVTYALRKIKEAYEEFLRPKIPEVAANNFRTSATISHALSFLLPSSSIESTVTHKVSKGKISKKNSKLKVTGVAFIRTTGERQVQMVRIEIPPRKTPVSVRLTVRYAPSSEKDRLNPADLRFTWLSTDHATILGNEAIITTDLTEIHSLVEAPAGYSLKFNVEESD